jgi:SAM-dependent methyltransferase
MDIEQFKGINLDIGCGGNKQKGFVGLDMRNLDGVDIVHNLEEFPYPLPDGCCHNIIGSHIVEHIKPWLMLQFMDELWRLLKPEGSLALSMPYGVSEGFVQDPTHCNPCNEATWQYFDHRQPLYTIYKSKPWSIKKGYPAWQVTGNLEVVLDKIEQIPENEVIDGSK